MKKRIVCLLLVFVMMIGFIPLNSTIAKASGADNITARIDYLYNMQWTALKDVTGWNNYVFKKGTTHRIPYGQPVSAGRFIYWGVTIEDYQASTKNVNSLFYTTPSDYSGYGGSSNPKSTYYALDCSAFASYCWDLPRRTTTSGWLSLDITSKGNCTIENISKIEQGDAINKAGSHIVLVSRIINGKYEITEQTVPEMKRTVYTAQQLAAKYSQYTIYKYNKISTVTPPTISEPETTTVATTIPVTEPTTIPTTVPTTAPITETTTLFEDETSPDIHCAHFCHSKSYISVFWKIVRFFWKLFGVNQYCACGEAHY